VRNALSSVWHRRYKEIYFLHTHTRNGRPKPQTHEKRGISFVLIKRVNRHYAEILAALHETVRRNPNFGPTTVSSTLSSGIRQKKLLLDWNSPPPPSPFQKFGCQQVLALSKIKLHLAGARFPGIEAVQRNVTAGLMVIPKFH
jgi:hypothetical protein